MSKQISSFYESTTLSTSPKKASNTSVIIKGEIYGARGNSIRTPERSSEKKSVSGQQPTPKTEVKRLIDHKPWQTRHATPLQKKNTSYQKNQSRAEQNMSINLTPSHTFKDFICQEDRLRERIRELERRNKELEIRLEHERYKRTETVKLWSKEKSEWKKERNLFIETNQKLVNMLENVNKEIAKVKLAHK